MKKKKVLRAGAVLVLGFLNIIILGSILLSLPVSRKAGVTFSYLDSLFVSVSAVCVTGLTPLDIAASLTLFGRIVLLTMIQLGGLGFASFAVLILYMLGRSVNLYSRNLAQEAMNITDGHSVMPIVKTAGLYSFVIEFLGGLLLMVSYVPRTSSLMEAFGMGIFHSISAFNNAGFDLNGDFSSLCSFHGDVYFNLVIAVLVLLGGIGFFVMSDVLHRRRWAKFSFHTKIVLVMTIVLVFGGMALLMLTGMNALDAFFLSVSARTAGFNTVPFEEISNGAMLITDILMFIGANPGSTGGGVKTTTIFAIFVLMYSVASGSKPVAFRRRIPLESILKAFAVVSICLMIIFVGCFLLMLLEGDSVPSMAIVFEVVSAAATVGLSRSLTPTLCSGSKIVLMVIMFIGRLGPLTIASLITGEKQERLEYLEENVLIG